MSVCLREVNSVFFNVGVRIAIITCFCYQDSKVWTAVVYTCVCVIYMYSSDSPLERMSLLNEKIVLSVFHKMIMIGKLSLFFLQLIK